MNLTANDTDPENNIPLVLLSVTRTSGFASASVTSASSVYVTTGARGTSVFSYSVRDSLGASATGQLTVTSTGTLSFCNGGGGGIQP